MHAGLFKIIFTNRLFMLYQVYIMESLLKASLTMWIIYLFGWLVVII